MNTKVIYSFRMLLHVFGFLGLFNSVSPVLNSIREEVRQYHYLLSLFYPLSLILSLVDYVRKSSIVLSVASCSRFLLVMVLYPIFAVLRTFSEKFLQIMRSEVQPLKNKLPGEMPCDFKSKQEVPQNFDKVDHRECEFDSHNSFISPREHLESLEQREESERGNQAANSTNKIVKSQNIANPKNTDQMSTPTVGNQRNEADTTSGDDVQFQKQEDLNRKFTTLPFDYPESSNYFKDLIWKLGNEFPEGFDSDEVMDMIYSSKEGEREENYRFMEYLISILKSRDRLKIKTSYENASKENDLNSMMVQQPISAEEKYIMGFLERWENLDITNSELFIRDEFEDELNEFLTLSMHDQHSSDDKTLSIEHKDLIDKVVQDIVSETTDEMRRLFKFVYPKSEELRDFLRQYITQPVINDTPDIENLESKSIVESNQQGFKNYEIASDTEEEDEPSCESESLTKGKDFIIDREFCSLLTEYLSEVGSYEESSETSFDSDSSSDLGIESHMPKCTQTDLTADGIETNEPEGNYLVQSLSAIPNIEDVTASDQNKIDGINSDAKKSLAATGNETSESLTKTSIDADYLTLSPSTTSFCDNAVNKIDTTFIYAVG